MTLKNERELVNTRRKLKDLDRLIEGAKAASGAGRDAEGNSLVAAHAQRKCLAGETPADSPSIGES
jgi:hypothetical protein